MKWIIILLIVTLGTSGCNYRKREEALQKKEAVLLQKEQELLLKEKTLQLREADVVKKEQLLDSTSNTDTSKINQAFVGSWLVKMICTETTCAGSAIGDTITELWIITYLANNIIVRAMDNEKLIRAYTGFVSGNTVELTEDRPGTDIQVATKMAVRLHMINNTTMEGEREITRQNDCKVLYDLKMEKQSQ